MGNGGCAGGNFASAYNYLEASGVGLYEDYPWKGSQGSCEVSARAAPSLHPWPALNLCFLSNSHATLCALPTLHCAPYATTPPRRLRPQVTDVDTGDAVPRAAGITGYSSVAKCDVERAVSVQLARAIPDNAWSPVLT